MPASEICWSARCTLRGLMPSAIARAELARILRQRARRELSHPVPLGVWRQHDDLARASRRQCKALIPSHSPPPACPSSARNRRSPLKSNAVIHRRVCRRPPTSISLVTSPGHPSASARARANNTGRVASETVVPGLLITLRQASMTNASDASSASTSSSTTKRSLPRAMTRARRLRHLIARHFPPPPSMPGCRPPAPLARPCRAQCALLPSARAELQFPPQARRRLSTQAEQRGIDFREPVLSLLSRRPISSRRRTARHPACAGR